MSISTSWNCILSSYKSEIRHINRIETQSIKAKTKLIFKLSNC